MIAADIRKLLEIEFDGIGIVGSWVTPDNIQAATNAPGAYIVCLRLPHAVHVALPRKAARQLPAAWYFYAGSAKGSGGIRARLNRHFKRTKALHWHVDRLTTKADQMAALAFEGGCECGLVCNLLMSGRYRIAAPGFGNSDCRQCDSHLLTLSSFNN